MLLSYEIRDRFLAFFAKRGHVVIPSASLVPLNDPSVLFNTAGMQPLVPYLLGEPHPEGVRIADSQKCVRTVDIDEIGDNTHATFFEMLGNWSLGDYFKKEAIEWSYEFLTSKDEGLGLDPRRLYITVFGGNTDAPKDEEAYATWKNIFERAGVPGERIYYMTADANGKEPNWWSPGDNGPCGPDSEMFYDVTGTLTEGLSKEAYLSADDRQDVVEIWNDVFMEYEKQNGKVIGKLATQNVDTGSGLERVTMVVQGKDNIFETDLLLPISKRIISLASNFSNTSEHSRALRIVSDHIRTSVFLVGDGVLPSNKDQGYILRRLMRRAIFNMYHHFDLSNSSWIAPMVDSVVAIYTKGYPELVAGKNSIIIELVKEADGFYRTLSRGKDRLERLLEETHSVSGKDAFDLFTTYGFPLELTVEMAIIQGASVDTAEFERLFTAHRELSAKGSEQKFKGGLADNSDATTRLHTAHHLLLRALQIVLGPEVHQRGSNITQERLRIDFNYGQKMTDEQKREVERIVNEQVVNALPVIRTEMALVDAEALGAEHEFGAKYPERVSVYSVGPKDATPEDPKFSDRYSIEFCGGPHVSNTSELGKFSIQKEEAVASGIRRIKGILS